MTEEPRQEVEAGANSVVQVAGRDQKRVTANVGGGGGRSGWAKWLAVLFGLAAVALLVLGLLKVIDWQTVAVPLILAFLVAVGAVVAAIK